MAGPNEKRDIGMTPEQKQIIAKQLLERGAVGPCSRCDYPHLSIHGRLTYIQLQQLADAIAGRVNESSVKTVVLVCGNCGWVSMHALGILGLKDLEPGPEGNTPTPGPPIVHWPRPPVSETGAGNE